MDRIEKESWFSRFQVCYIQTHWIFLMSSLLTIWRTFHSLFKVLFIFPSQYLFAIGLWAILLLALDEIYHPFQFFVLYSQTTRLEEPMSHIPLLVSLTITRDCHPLWCPFPWDFNQKPRRVGRHWFSRLQFALRITQERFPIWAFPCSVALTWGILVSFFYLRLLICLNSAGTFTW